MYCTRNSSFAAWQMQGHMTHDTDHMAHTIQYVWFVSIHIWCTLCMAWNFVIHKYPAPSGRQGIPMKQDATIIIVKGNFFQYSHFACTHTHTIHPPHSLNSHIYRERQTGMQVHLELPADSLGRAVSARRGSSKGM